MTDENVPETNPTASKAVPDNESSGGPDSVYLVSYPKIVFLYPSVFVALFGAIYMFAKGGDASADYAWLPGRLFLFVLMVNLVVVSFDFPRTTSLTWFFAAVAMSVVLWTLFQLNPDFAPWVTRQMQKFTPAMNTSFYVLYVMMMMFLFLCVVLSRRFDYWEVRGNELLHHHGVLSDLERFSAPNLRIQKEINDIFEYLLLRSGRLIIHTSQESRAIVLENVFFINQKEELITRSLGALQVRVRPDNT